MATATWTGGTSNGGDGNNWSWQGANGNGGTINVISGQLVIGAQTTFLSKGQGWVTVVLGGTLKGVTINQNGQAVNAAGVVVVDGSVANILGNVSLDPVALQVTAPVPWPTTLAGTTVTIVDVSGTTTQAPVLYASSTQVNFQIPDTVLLGPVTITVTATIGGKAATVLYAGPQGYYPGVDQVNVVIPQSLSGAGSVPVVVTAGGVQSNTVTITIQ